MARIHYLSPAYGFDVDLTHIGETEGAEETLRRMGAELAGRDGLVGIYIPEGTEDAYQPGNMRGRVVGAVRLTPMPEGKTIRDYFYPDLDGSLRWPIGWPCEVVHAPKVDDCRYFRSIIEDHYGLKTFASFTSQFQRGPVELTKPISAAILAYME